MCLPFSQLNGDWMVAEMRLTSTFPVTIQSPFSHNSVTIQSKERWDFILWFSFKRMLSRCIRQYMFDKIVKFYENFIECWYGFLTVLEKVNKKPLDLICFPTSLKHFLFRIFNSISIGIHTIPDISHLSLRRRFDLV